MFFVKKMKQLGEKFVARLGIYTPPYYEMKIYLCKIRYVQNNLG
jgi:hypothetical protein